MSGTISDEDWDLAESSSEVHSERTMDDWDIAKDGEGVEDHRERRMDDWDLAKDGEGVEVHSESRLPMDDWDLAEDGEGVEYACKEEILKLDENISKLNKESVETADQVESLRSYSTSEIRKVEEKTEMVKKLLTEDMLKFEQELAEERAARLKVEDALEAALRCTTETGEKLDSYKQEMSKVEENVFRSNEEKLQGITEMFEKRLEETRMKYSAEAENKMLSLQDYSTREIRKVEEEAQTVMRLLTEALNKQFAQERVARLKAEDALQVALVRCSTDITEQAEYLKDYTKEEIYKAEEKTQMVEQSLRETMLRLERELAKERVERVKAEIICITGIGKQLESLEAHTKQKIRKVEENIEMVEEVTLQLEGRLDDEMTARNNKEAALVRCITETGEQLESLEAYTKQEISKVEENIEMDLQVTLHLEGKLDDEMNTRNNKEAALVRCITETREQLESLETYMKQKISEVEENIEMDLQVTLQLEGRLDDEMTARYKNVDSVAKDILGLDANIGLLGRRLDELVMNKEKEVETYISNEEKLKEIIEKVEQRFRKTTLHLEQQLAEEKAARVASEVSLREAQIDSSNEICKLKENLAKAEKETEELRKIAKSRRNVANELSLPAPRCVHSSVVRGVFGNGFCEVQVKRASPNSTGSYIPYISSEIVVPVRPRNIAEHQFFQV